jgi:hypothetical protein
MRMQASKSSSEHFTAVGKLSAEVFTGQRPARGRRWLDEIVTGVATESKDCRARKMQCRKVARFISHPIWSKQPSKIACRAGLELPVSAIPRPSGRVSTGYLALCRDWKPAYAAPQNRGY